VSMVVLRRHGIAIMGERGAVVRGSYLGRIEASLLLDPSRVPPSPNKRWVITDRCGPKGDQGWCVFDGGSCVAHGLSSPSEALVGAHRLYREESRPAVEDALERVLAWAGSREFNDGWDRWAWDPAHPERRDLFVHVAKEQFTREAVRAFVRDGVPLPGT
jgi:hypothetical protein